MQGAGGIGGLITAIEGVDSYQYFYDGNGNVGQLINTSDASIAALYEYDPYGNELVATGPEAQNNVYRFSTKYFDDETDLYYYGFRYYSASLGRWLSKDSFDELGFISLISSADIDGKAGDNLYVFVFNNPITYIDVIGLWSYKGYCRYLSGGEILGVGVLRCRLWTFCRRDKTRDYGEIVATFGGLTAGVPLGVTYFNIELDRRSFSEYPQLSDLKGFATIKSLGLAIGPLGASWMKLKLGLGYGEFSGWQMGLDASMDCGWGYSSIEWNEKRCCSNIWGD